MDVKKAAIEVVQTLQRTGFIAYFAGGWVRDLIMQHPSDDIDIATSASVSEVQALFSKTIPVGVAFGIVIVVHGGHHFEVATFRKDRGYVDGRRPSGIDPASPEEDAKRRDFTINGLFYDPIKEKIYDFIGGQEDIKRKIIRAIGDPHERFAEDRLRMMRAVRYSTRFDFPIEKKTEQAILTHASELLPAVAMERIWQEFKKMSLFAHFDRGLEQLHRLGILPTIFPELKGLSVDEIWKRLQFIERFPKGSPTFAELLELFPHYGLQEIEALAEKLKLSNEETVFAYFYQHAKTLFQMPKDWREKLENFEWAIFYADPHCDLCLNMLAAKEEAPEKFLSEHQNRQKQLEKGIQRLKTKNPYIKAEDLFKEGVQAGVKMGVLLKEAMRIAINEGIEEKEAILQKLKKSRVWNSS